MKEMLKTMFTSKKVWMAILAVVAFFLGKFGLQFEAAELYVFVAPWIALLGGQAVADIGKEAEKLRSADRGKAIDFAKEAGTDNATNLHPIGP